MHGFGHSCETFVWATLLCCSSQALLFCLFASTMVRDSLPERRLRLQSLIAAAKNLGLPPAQIIRDDASRINVLAFMGVGLNCPPQKFKLEPAPV